MDFEKLTADLLTAKQNSLKMIHSEDGGTCNFDTCVLYIKRVNFFKLSEAVYKANLRVSKWKSGEYHIYGYEFGQANRRTEMVEEFTKTLKDLGYDAFVYYQMD